jgi:hypothetical protein
MAAAASVQPLLIHVVDADDYHLENQADLVWFHVLRNLDWRPLRPVAAQYYGALQQFNVHRAAARARRKALRPNPETQEQATQRLLFERPTLDANAPTIVDMITPQYPSLHADPQQLRPGHVPWRLAGRAPKCFFAMFKAFQAMPLRGRPPEPEHVHEELRSNPAFVRACGFTLRDPKLGYRQSDRPGLRKLQQFDQIMTDHGLWAKAALDQVARNLQQGRIQPEASAVHDTTHYPAYSSFRTVELPAAASANAPEPSSPPPLTTTPAADASQQLLHPVASLTGSAAGKNRRKSQPRTTKSCRCPDRDHCPHPWSNADDGAGTVVKAGGKMYWAHKASTLVFPGQNVLLDAVAVTDAATHDSQSLIPHLDRLFRHHPELWGQIDRVLDDGAADDAALKEEVGERFGIQLLTPINPRRRGALTQNMPRGIDHITNTGTPVCRAGRPFDFVGCRHDSRKFLFRAPNDADGQPLCNGCPLRSECCRRAEGPRCISIGFDRLPWIDPQFPQLSQGFRKAIAQRTAVERVHKLMKFDYGDEYLSKRGNAAFQARLDKTLLAMHLVIAQT